MVHYRSNLRDLEFVLFELLDAGAVLGRGPFADIGRDDARAALATLERIATTDVAASFAAGDREPPRFDPQTGSVTLTPAVLRSYRALVDGGWHRLGVPAELGGDGAPTSLRWACAELVLGANPAVFLYACGPSCAAVLHRLGTPAQRRLAELMVERDWGATMVLTEPDAGSDVGASRTTAIAQPDGTWRIEGVKRFITGGDWDGPENLVHFVLARPVGARPGTKGLSLFVVPKYVVDLETGALRGRNGVYVTAVEKKMGLTASATCELCFGDRAPAVGSLVGDVHDGIAQMFEVIAHARMMVGAKAMSTLSTAYLHALEFATSRVQGPDLATMADKTAPRVPIIRHPDVRRMLLLQKAYAEGLRALVLYAARLYDDVALGDASAAARAELLLPVVKGFGSEKASELLPQCLQILGGSGYLTDYPLEQYVRDAKVDTLYEGTTGIQGLDLFFRKTMRDDGRALGRLLSEIGEFAKSDAGGADLVAERALLGAAVADVTGIVSAMVAFVSGAREEPREIYSAGLNTTRLLMALGDLLVGWLLLRAAVVAIGRLEDGTPARDIPFYAGKVAAARYFAANRLPLLAAERALAEATDRAVMELPEEAF